MDNSTPQRSRVDVKSLSNKLIVLDLLDPRSPTNAFQRTPIQVVLKNLNTTDETIDTNSTGAVQSSPCSFITSSSPQMDRDESLELSASSASFTSFDDVMDIESINLTSEDLSMVVSDCSLLEDEIAETAVVTSTTDELKISNSDALPRSTDTSEPSVTTPNANVTTEQIPSVDSSTCDTGILTESSLQDEIVIRKPPKKQFYTPNPNKKRNPLGPVDNVCPTTPPSHYSYGSPQGVLREKQWKRIQEERKKLGLESDENVPLPLYDVTASAPSKLMLRKMKMQGRFNVLS